MEISKLSIIIPHKNSLFTLKRLVNTIPIDEEFEIIIVDDHSDAKIKLKLREFCSENGNLKLYENSLNSTSAGAARNLGLKYAKGEWILFADADDLYLESFEHEFEKYKKSDAEVIYFRPLLDTSNRKGVFIFTKIFDIFEDNPTEENKLLLKLHMDTPWSKLIKRQLIDEYKIKFDEVKKHNDTMFSKKVAIHAMKIEIVNSSIYQYEINNHGISATVNKESYLSIVDVQSRAIKLMIENYEKKILMKVYPEAFYLLIKLLIDGIKQEKNLKIVKEFFAINKKNGTLKFKYYNLFLAYKAYRNKKRIFKN